MEITALIVLCIIAALLALSLRGQRPEFAMLLSLGCGLFVLPVSVGANEGHLFRLGGYSIRTFRTKVN